MEIFSRGKGGQSDCVHSKYPWLYIRALAFTVIAFGVFAFAYVVSENSFDYPSVVLFGGLLFNIPLLILFYELYPRSDIKLSTLFAVTVVGGIISTAIITIGYRFITLDGYGQWIALIWTGFWEELCKAVPAIAAIYLLKRKKPFDPFYCFLIGAAVGTGYSFCEDIGYIYVYSSYYSQTMTWAVLMSVGRGFACFCSHAPWTGMICYAFAKFGLKNFRLYAVTFFIMFLHYWADVPFFCSEAAWYKGGVAIWIFTVGAILIMTVCAIKSSRKAITGVNGARQIEMLLPLPVRDKLSYAADVCACLSGIVLSVLVMIYCVIPTGYGKTLMAFNDEQSLINFMQEGLPLYADWEREYDCDAVDYSQFIKESGLKTAVQKQTVGEYEYYYFYTFIEETSVLTNIGLIYDNNIYYCARIIIINDTRLDVLYGYPSYQDWITLPEVETVINDDENEEDGDYEERTEDGDGVNEEETVTGVISYFPIKGGANNFAFDRESGNFTLTVSDNIYHGIKGKIAVCALAGIFFAGGAAAYITLKLKARRYENVER